jgi:lysyl-tRNA synthetase class 1
MKELFWADQIAQQIIEKWNAKIFRTEMGLGASGVPHVGSTGDGIRSFVVNLALKDRGVKSEFIAYSDDRDGLRKIPAGFPDSLEKDIGKPVSQINDPFGCHESYGEHVSSLLTDAFMKLGVSYKLKKASLEYTGGKLDKEIIDILENWKQTGEIIKKITGQDKYLNQLPYMSVCEKCGRIYTTRAYKFDGEKIHYKCDQSFVGKNSNNEKTIEIKGCGHEGVANIRDGKLAWKVEFAARWRALKINYEAYGKDILDSVRCNDVVCEDVLKRDPPVHSFYEMFTERSGKKISKSAGNVFTPQMWIRYASPLSLRLLFLKRLGTTRVVDPDAIPSYMDELNELSQVYFNKKKISNEHDAAHMKRLFEYAHFLKKPQEQYVQINYNMLATLMKLAKNKKIVKDILQRTGHIAEMTKNAEKELDEKLAYAENWIKDTIPEKEIKIDLTEKQKKALKKLAHDLETKKFNEEEMKARLYDIAREHNLEMQEFFKGAYLTILGSERGPRLAQFILAMGQKKIADILREKLS